MDVIVIFITGTALTVAELTAALPGAHVGERLGEGLFALVDAREAEESGQPDLERLEAIVASLCPPDPRAQVRVAPLSVAGQRLLAALPGVRSVSGYVAGRSPANLVAGIDEVYVRLSPDQALVAFHGVHLNLTPRAEGGTDVRGLIVPTTVVDALEIWLEESVGRAQYRIEVRDHLGTVVGASESPPPSPPAALGPPGAGRLPWWRRLWPR